MDPSSYGGKNQKWVRQYEQIESKATVNLAMCMQNLLREAHKIPSRDELKSSRRRMDDLYLDQKRAEFEARFKEWERQNELNLQQVQDKHFTSASGPHVAFQTPADHTHSESIPVQQSPA